MKKVFAILVVIGLIISGGVRVAVSAGDEYWDIPQAVTPPGGN